MLLGGNRSDMERQINTMLANGTVYSIISTMANSTAMAKWCLYRKRGPRADVKATRTPVNRHAAVDLWNRPNPFFTGQELVESVQQHVECVGEGYMLVVRSDMSSIPLELWPIRPDRMTPVPGVEEFLMGWIYTGPNGEKVSLDLDQVIQIRNPHPLDPYRGLGSIQPVLTDIETARYSAEWNRRYFLNGARPGGIIEVPGSLDDRGAGPAAGPVG